MRVLVAVDLAAEPQAVADRAGRWAARLGARLDVVYADDTPAVATYVTDPTLTAIVLREEQRLREQHQQRVSAVLEALPADVRGDVHVVGGPPAEAIVAKADGYDLLIVATHGREGLAHLWLGSVAERIVRTSPVPVLVLRLGTPT